MKELTEIDKKLQQIALTDWPLFVSMVGADAIIRAKVCLLRKEGKSYEQVSTKLHISYKRARSRSRSCACNAQNPNSE